jgi:hypothetical protein
MTGSGSTGFSAAQPSLRHAALSIARYSVQVVAGQRFEICRSSATQLFNTFREFYCVGLVIG